MPKIDMNRGTQVQGEVPGRTHDENGGVNANGTLANVFVYVKSGPPASYAAPGRRRDR